VTGAVVWVTGLPAAGKSTLARRLAARLREAGRACLVLDSDEVRAAIRPPHGYDEAGRDAFYGTLAALAALAARQGLVAIVPGTAHRRAWREQARQGAPRFVEVYVATPLEECRRRDPRGLYGSGVAGVPGVDVPYEPPPAPDVVAPRGDDPVAVDQVLARLGAGGG
jgi:adenylylsulfate kinase